MPYPVFMPKDLKGRKRPADVISNAVHVMRIAIGEIDETKPDDGKSRAAIELGRMGGSARARAMSKTQRAKIARTAARARWGTPKKRSR